MTTTNLQTCTTAAPHTLVSQFIPTTGAAQYQAAVGTTTECASVLITNNDTVARVVTVKVVPAGGSAGSTPAVLPAVSLAAGAVVDLGQMFLADGDSIWAQAGTVSTIGITITGIEFSNATGAVLTGIQDDAIGSGGRTASSTTVTGTNLIGTRNNRYLLGALLVMHQTSGVTYSSYSTLTMSCTFGAMTPLVSCNFAQSTNLNGSIHLFGIAAPTSSSTQTLTATAVTGSTDNLTLASMSLSGVASVTGAATSGPSSAAAMSLAVSSAVGHRPIFAACFQNPPMDFNERVRAFNGNPAIGFDVPHWLILADALGASTVTATTSSSDSYAAVGIDLVPA